MLLEAFNAKVVHGCDGADEGLVDELGGAPVPFIVGHVPTDVTAGALEWFQQPVDERGKTTRLMFLGAIAGGRGLNIPDATDVRLQCGTMRTTKECASAECMQGSNATAPQ